MMKKWVFKSDLELIALNADRNDSGIQFHIAGPETEKAISPIV
jgi:hypothetical protein